MSKYLKVFDMHSQYESYINSGRSALLPNVSFCRDGMDVHINPERVIESILVCTYDVQSEYEESMSTQLYAYGEYHGEMMFSEIIIDDTPVSISSIDENEGQYVLSVGEHTVRYKLINPERIGMDEETGDVGAVFMGCASLTGITIPSNVTSISIEAFESCAALASISVEQGNPVYDSRNNCNAIIETSSNKLLFACNNTTIPSTVVSIGSYSFSNCYDMESITIPGSVRTIESDAFYSCGISSVTIGNGVTSIGNYAFHETNLTSITIPASVTSIGDIILLSCFDMTTIVVDSNNTVYDSRNSCNAIVETAANKIIQGCVNSTVPGTIASIETGAFCGYDDIDSNVYDTILSINPDAFDC